MFFSWRLSIDTFPYDVALAQWDALLCQLRKVPLSKAVEDGRLRPRPVITPPTALRGRVDIAHAGRDGSFVEFLSASFIGVNCSMHGSFYFVFW